jgi:hypothetical protein
MGLCVGAHVRHRAGSPLSPLEHEGAVNACHGKMLFLVANSTIPWPCQPAELEKHEYDKSIDKSGSHLGKSY